MLHQLREDRGPITLFVETLSGQLRKSMIVPDQCLSIANYIISQMNLIYPGGSHRSPLLLVSKTHLEDICADYFSLASLPLGFRFERKLYPFAINSTVVTPLSRQLLQLEYLSESDFNTSLSLLTKSDESHTLYFSSRKSLVVFLRILLRAQTSRSVSSDQFSLLHRYLDETAVQSSLLFTTVDEQLVLSLTHSTSPRKTYSVPVEDITQVTPSTFLPLSCPLEVTLEIFNFLSPDIRSSSTAMVSVLTMSGQYRSTIFSCDSTARDHGTIRFFSSFDDIKNESVLLSLHIQEDSSKEYQTLGEVVLPLSRVVFSEHERFPVGVPRFERFQLQPPRYALM